MTDDDSAALNISRRKTLAALGTIGVASAGAGLGTSAYFSDQETFQNNSLTAGTLDMVVDWEEHYSDWKGAETEYAEMPTGDENEEDIYTLPAPDDNPDAEDIELVFSDKQAFWDATAVEAYPDAGNDGLQDPIEVPCDDLGSLDDVLSSDDRTEGEVNGQTTEPGDPLISLQDVKPGDFGEVTLSFHLCDNPGFVWFGGDLIRHVDGENTEPEIDDPDEQQSADEIGPDTPGELADQIQVRAWYDTDCDNMYEPETPAACAYHLFDNSGTMEQNLAQDTGTADKSEMAALIGTGVTEHLDTIDDGGDDGTLAAAPSSVGYMSGNDGSTVQPETNSQVESDVNTAINAQAGDTGATGISADDLVAGLEDAQAALEDCENDNKVLIVYGNGDTRPGDEPDRQAVYDAAADVKAAGITIKVVGFDVDAGSSDEDFLETMGDELYIVNESSNATEVVADAEAVRDDIIAQFDDVTEGEDLLYEGTLLEFLNGTNPDGEDGEPFDPDNNQLGFPLDGDLPAEDGGGMGRNCFSATTTHCIGFEWWLPIDHGNEVQGDIVEFDLGFYTEQCRHNDGEGMNSETVNG
jgi:predicted ribosomally synthesized peptide with SipW-like signal peptide